MKTTYLINSIQPDGSTALVETTAEHWHEITENNKLLPKDERRYFITDIISESGNLDRMIIEASYKEYLRWMVERSPTIRNNSLKKQYTHLSLDAEIANDAIDPRVFEEDVMSRVCLLVFTPMRSFISNTYWAYSEKVWVLSSTYPFLICSSNL